MAQRYEGILFDFDGVIVDSEPMHYAAWRDVLTPLGIPFEWDYYVKHFVGVADRTVIEAAVARAKVSMSAEEVFTFFPKKTEIYRQRAQAAPPFVPGLAQLFDELRGCKLAVVSSSKREEVEPLLRIGGFFERLDLTICAEDVERLKPDPEPYRKAAQLLGVTRALVVEDSEVGAASGAAAGFEVLRIAEPAEMAAVLRRHLGAGR